MFCPKCGQQHVGGRRFCAKCGAQLPLSSGAPPAGAAVAVETGVYAGFWKRFAAFVLDYIIVIVLAMLAGGAIGFIYGTGAFSAGGAIAEGLGGLAGVLVWWLYYALMESSDRQATLGKMALGIRVVDREGGRISFGRATGRNFAKLLSGLILMIGYLMAGFTARKQALHDIVAGCLVVNRGATEEQVRLGVPAAGMPVWAIVLIVLAVCLFPIGIIAAVAIPAYQDMTVRSRIYEAVRAGNEATVAVEEFYDRHHSLPRDQREAGIPDPDPRNVQRVYVDPRTGSVQVVLAVPPLQGKSILFEPRRESDDRIVWTCASNDINPRYLPGRCRK